MFFAQLGPKPNKQVLSSHFTFRIFEGKTHIFRSINSSCDRFSMSVKCATILAVYWIFTENLTDNIGFQSTTNYKGRILEALYMDFESKIHFLLRTLAYAD